MNTEQKPLETHAALAAMIHYLRDIERVNWKLTEKRLEMIEDEIIAIRTELKTLKK